jgi:serine/threonine-protein kinase
MRVELRVIEGPQSGRSFVFDRHDTFIIGRSESAHFRLPNDPFFSRHHCIIEIAPPKAFVRDLSSTNGTYVNGRRVESSYLKSGDRIQGGETVIVVNVSSGDENATAELNREPSVVSVPCLNCSIPVRVEADFADEQMTYVCDPCREKLLSEPQPIPGYQVLRVLGKGGMGSVMLCRSEENGQAVAIKTLLPEVAVSEQSLKRFQREIEVAASLHHPNIVRFIEQGTHNGMIYLVSEFVQGMDAGRLASMRGGRLGQDETMMIIDQTLAALDHAHQLGFVHRDIKEQNIIVSGEFPNLTAKLTDFGLSKSFKDTGMSGVTMVGDVAGTIAYMPPEQIREFKEVRPPTDIYSLGMTAYSLLTGKNALGIDPKAGIAETVKAIFEKPIIPLATHRPDVPAAVASVIEVALSKTIENRWRSAKAMREALNNALRSS